MSGPKMCLKTVEDPTGYYVTCFLLPGHDGLHKGPRARGESFSWSEAYVTQNVTSVEPDADDPQNIGSKPEFNWQEDYY